MVSKSLKEDIEELKESTIKLGKQLSDATQEHLFDTDKIRAIPREIATNINRNLSTLREKVGGLADDTYKQTKKVDEKIHNKPYWFLAGAFGAGLVISKFLDLNRSRNRKES